MNTTTTLGIENLLSLFAETIKETFGKEIKFIKFSVVGEDDGFTFPIPKRRGSLDRRHSDDYRTVIWDGVPYKFTSLQAAAVRMLWESEFQELSQQVILEEIGSDSNRLRDLFRNHQAWGEMIVPGEKGTVKLA